MFAGEMQIHFAPFSTPMDDLAIIVTGDFLVSETEADNRYVEVVDGMGVFGIFAVRGKAGATRDNDPFKTLEGLNWVFRLANFGEDAMAPNLGGNQVSILPTEIDDRDSIVLHRSSAPPKNPMRGEQKAPFYPRCLVLAGWSSRRGTSLGRGGSRSMTLRRWRCRDRLPGHKQRDF